MADKFQTREERRKKLQQSKKGSNKKKSKSLFKRILFFMMIFAIVGIIGGAATFAYFVSTTPELDESLLKDPISSKIYDSDKELIEEVGKENRDYVTFDEIPQTVKDAIIATEDSRFYKHNGVDVLRLGSAVIANFTDGFGSQGASTITQQLVKRSFLSPDKTLKRKSQELWLSLQIEQKYSKEEIFEMYVNKIFYGAGANGIATAAETYYGKPLDKLELHEAATLAGLPQSPSAYNPFNHPERAEKRRNVVLTLMNKHGYITEKQMKEAQAIDIKKTLLTEEERAEENTDPYNAFIDQVIEEIEEKTDYNVFTDGLEIYTTIDRDAQEYVYNMLNTNDVIEFPDDKMQTGITLLDTKTGAIRAIGGGRKQTVKRGLNYATNFPRQPGSTIKPILDYGPAIEHLKWSTYEQIVDEPYTYSNGTKINNYNQKYHGQMSIRQALAKSYNIPALKAMQAVGLDKSRAFGEKLGLDFKDEFEEAYSIGGMPHGFTTMEMAGAFSAFGNEGIYNEPYTVTKVVLADKKTTLDLKPEPKVVMKESTAFMISDMLKSVMTSGTGTRANVPGLDVAGKSGTTNYSKKEREDWNIESRSEVPDSWFVGYTTNYTASIWTGYESRKNSLNKEEQKYPQRMFKSLMSHVSEGKKTKDFTKPNSVVKSPVEKGSNPAKLPSDFTPEDQIVYEYFIKGTEPTKVSESFDKLDAPTNLNVNYDDELKEVILTWNYPEQNDSDKKPVFEVKESIDNAAEKTLQTTEDKEARISNPTPGSIYKFSVTAIVGDLKSETVTASIKIPDLVIDEEVPEEDTENGGGNNGEEENPEEGNTPPEEEENPNPEDGNGNGDNGNGNGNGNQPGNGTGSGNGNNSGNNPVNGSGDSSEDNPSNESSNPPIQQILFLRFFNNIPFF